MGSAMRLRIGIFAKILVSQDFSLRTKEVLKAGTVLYFVQSLFSCA